MRSLIIIEVEHGEDTDGVDAFMDYMCSRLPEWELTYKDSTVRVDLPACFALDSGVPEGECPRHGGPVGGDETCPCTPESTD